MSDDGEHAVVVIALVGNPFSPDYASARQRGEGSPLDFAAMNVAVYGRRGTFWSLRERRIATHDRSRHGVAIGPSTMEWRGDALLIDVNERTTPFGAHVRGRVVLRPETLCPLDVTLDRAGLHRWWPVAPLARIEVDLDAPRLRFSGHGYHDANAGTEPIDAAFERWSWSRARSRGAALLTYDVERADGTAQALGLRVSAKGELTNVDVGDVVRLGRTRWGLERTVRAGGAREHRAVRSLEDGPFYARALLEANVDGHPVRSMHEVLDAERLRRRWVRFLTGFRMGKAA